MMRRLNFAMLTALTVFLGLPLAGQATGDHPAEHPFCQGHPLIHEALLAQDAAHLRRLARDRADAPPEKQAALTHKATVTREGEIAILEADDEMVIPANLFDLEGRAIRFMRRGQRYAVGREKPGIHRPIGRKIELQAFTAERVRFNRGARFPFGGKTYRDFWIHAAGYVTFEGPKTDANRSLEFLMEGPPTIAPLLLPLAPEAAVDNGGVYFFVTPGKEIRVTWLRVPSPLLGNERVTMQMRLKPDGRITFAYQKVGPGEGILGIFPPQNGLRVLDLDEELPVPARRGAVAEVFGSTPQLNHPAISRAFLSAFPDDFDHLVTWYDFPTGQGGYFETSPRNAIRGIGEQIYDSGPAWGSPRGGRLSAYLFMNAIAEAPDDPDEPLAPGFPSLIKVLGHEAGHRWASFTRFRDPRDGATSDAMLGRQLAHWSFHLDTDGSVMEGNDIRDNGDGTFTTTASWLGYSDLDLYLMGLAPASQVQPFFLVDGNGNPDRAAGPQDGVQLNGERVDISLDDIIAIEGRRAPGFTNAQKDFRMAFLLVTLPGEAPAAGSVAKLDVYRQRWEAWWAEATGSISTVETALGTTAP